MKKSATVLQAAIQDIRTGKAGKINERYYTIREFCQVYPVSYMTAVSIFDEMKQKGVLRLQNRTHIIADCEPSAGNCKRKLIGVHVRDMSTFYAALYLEMNRLAERYGFHLVVMCSNNSNTEKKRILQQFVDLGCEGVVNLNSLDDESLADFYRLYPLPFVMYGASPIKNVTTDFVLTDNYASGAQAAKFLIKIGSERFYYVCNDKLQPQQDERQAGFRQYLASDNKELTVITFPDDDSDAKHSDHYANLLAREAKERKLGIFCHHDLFAVTVLKMLDKKNVKVPDAAAVVGYDDLQIARYFEPNLTTFSYSFTKIADSCMRLLQLRMTTNNRKPPETIVIPTILMVRQSAKSDAPLAT